jgi:hypothetical protein
MCRRSFVPAAAWTARRPSIDNIDSGNANPRESERIRFAQKCEADVIRLIARSLSRLVVPTRAFPLIQVRLSLLPFGVLYRVFVRRFYRRGACCQL